MPSSTDAVVARFLDALRSAGLHLCKAPDRPPGRPPEILSGRGDLLAGMRLSSLERAAVQILLDCSPARKTLPQLRDLIEDALGEIVSEGTLRFVLSRLTSPGVEILDNDRSANPPGYQVTRDFVEEIALRHRSIG